MDKFLPWSLSVALAVCAFWLGQRYLVTTAENQLLRDQKALSEVAFKTADTQLQAERILSQRLLGNGHGIDGLKVALLTPKSAGNSGASAVVVWDPTLRDGLCVVAIPGANPQQRFQLRTTGSHQVDLGTFALGSDGRAQFRFKPDEPLGPATPFAVSPEGRHDDVLLSSD